MLDQFWSKNWTILTWNTIFCTFWTQNQNVDKLFELKAEQFWPEIQKKHKFDQFWPQNQNLINFLS